MRDYGKIFCSFWDDEEIQSLPDFEVRLASYILTCKHGNLAGCFRLPIGYIIDDLKLHLRTSEPGFENPFERVSEGLLNLQETGLIVFDRVSQWVWIPNFLKWNGIENQNQVISYIKLLEQVPKKVSFHHMLAVQFSGINGVIGGFKPGETTEKVKLLFNDFKQLFETLSEPLANPSETSNSNSNSNSSSNSKTRAHAETVSKILETPMGDVFQKQEWFERWKSKWPPEFWTNEGTAKRFFYGLVETGDQALIFDAAIENQIQVREWKKKHGYTLIPNLKYPDNWLLEEVWKTPILTEEQIIKNRPKGLNTASKPTTEQIISQGAEIADELEKKYGVTNASN